MYSTGAKKEKKQKTRFIYSLMLSLWYAEERFVISFASLHHQSTDILPYENCTPKVNIICLVSKRTLRTTSIQSMRHTPCLFGIESFWSSYYASFHHISVLLDGPGLVSPSIGCDVNDHYCFSAKASATGRTVIGGSPYIRRTPTADRVSQPTSRAFRLSPWIRIRHN